MEITGKLYKKRSVEQISSTFSKREFVIIKKVVINEDIVEDFIKFQLNNSKTELIDKFEIDDIIRVKFNIKGNESHPKDGSEVQYYNNLVAYRIENANPTTNA